MCCKSVVTIQRFHGFGLANLSNSMDTRTSLTQSLGLTKMSRPNQAQKLNTPKEYLGASTLI